MTRKRCLTGLILLLCLAGCMPPGSGTGSPPPLARTALADGAVVVAGAEGYCIDPVTLSRRKDRDFAVIASCNILSGGTTGRVVAPVMITVTVGTLDPTPTLPAPAMLAQEAGQTLVRGDTRNGLVVAQLAGGGSDLLEGGDPRYWRGAFVQNGHMVGLALYAPQGSVLAGPDGAAMLRAVHEQTGRLSPSGLTQ